MAPIYASTVYDRLGWRWCTDIVGLLFLSYALLYLCAGGGCDAVFKTYRRRKRLNREKRSSSDDDYKIAEGGVLETDSYSSDSPQ